MIVAIAADHGGFSLKNDLLVRLGGQFSFSDMGAENFNANDDYPDYAFTLAREVVSGKADKGVLICGSGVGACIAANKIKGARAGVCHDTYSAHQGVEHDDMNILCLGARVIGVELAVEIVMAFLNADFKRKPKYRRRLDKILTMEEQTFRTTEVNG